MKLGSRHAILGAVAAASLLASLPAGAGETHAEAQLAAILRDRPQLAASLATRPAVRSWILERFRVTDPPLYWDAAPPVSGRAAEWDGRDPRKTFVRVDGKPGGIDQLVHLVFELHNVQGYEVLEAVHQRAVQDEITREEYATLMLEQEFRALLAARAFYREHIAELSPLEEREARSYYRLLHGTDSFEEHLADGLRRGHDLRDHYRALWDTMVLSERQARDQDQD